MRGRQLWLRVIRWLCGCKPLPLGGLAESRAITSSFALQADLLSCLCTKVSKEHTRGGIPLWTPPPGRWLGWPIPTPGRRTALSLATARSAGANRREEPLACTDRKRKPVHPAKVGSCGSGNPTPPVPHIRPERPRGKTSAFNAESESPLSSLPGRTRRRFVRESA